MDLLLREYFVSSLTNVMVDSDISCSERQYKTRISQWRLDKNIQDDEIRFMAQMQVKRKLEDKETKFQIRGRDVNPEKISRAVKRKKISDEELLAMPTARKIF